MLDEIVRETIHERCAQTMSHRRVWAWTLLADPVSNLFQRWRYVSPYSTLTDDEKNREQQVTR